MNRREAKRQVCHDAALILENALTTNDHGSLSDLDGPDEDRLDAAWSDLIRELTRRGAPGAGTEDGET